MHWGLIELHVDVTGIRASGQTAAVMQGVLQNPAARAAAVQQAIEHARRLRCDFVELPGWSVVADQPPSWLLELSSGCTVIFECLFPGPDGSNRGASKGKSAQLPARPKGTPAPARGEVPTWCSWRCYVVHDGQVVVGPAPQYVAGAGELWEGVALSQQGIALVQALQERGTDGRRWMIPRLGDAMLIVCGEANLIGGGGPSACWNWDAVEAAGLTEQALASVRCIANPAHTRSKPQALRDKRAWLSRSGLLLHTANTHTDGWEREQDGEVTPGNASRGAARVWLHGEPCTLEEHAGEGYVLKTFEWAP